jgi:DNA ligase-1
MDRILHSEHIHTAISQIAAASGNAKQALINEAMDHEPFVKVCKLALDPFITYGIKKVPEISGEGQSKMMGTDEFDLLDKLASRELTGNAAKEAIEKALKSLTPKSAELLTKIIKKDLVAGFSAKAVNKAAPGTIYTFECMLAHKFEEKRITFPIAVEPKYDGVRCLAMVKNDEVKFFSRTGKEYLNYEHIGVDLLTLLEKSGITEDWVFDGEAMAETFNETVGSARRSGGNALDSKYYYFESMSAKDFEEGNKLPHAKRRAAMNEMTGQNLEYDYIVKTPMIIAKNLDNIMDMYTRILGEGGEGVIVKPLRGLYQRKRSYDWLKIKDMNSADCVIRGTFEGEGTMVGTLGGFIVDFKDVEVRVGSGLTGAMRSLVWSDRGSVNGKMIEVQYHEVTPDGSLRHPRFIKFRDDKPLSDGPGV